MLKKLFAGCLMLVIAVFALNQVLLAQQNRDVILATTTSVQDTGLLDVLVEAFRKKTGLSLKAIAVGTGQALQLGRQGEADILWVHSPDDEKQFVEEGYGLNRTTFMHNDFVILGPKNDPAKVIGSLKANEAFRKISGSKNLFVSRGDNSGTHKKEMKIWKEAGISPDRETYIEVGQGMAATVGVANEKQGYVLADRSTYLSLKKSIDLVIVCEGDKSLLNYYSLILVNPVRNKNSPSYMTISNGVNPQKFPKVNAGGAKGFFNFMLSKEAKDIIEDFGKEKYGGQLFFYDSFTIISYEFYFRRNKKRDIFIVRA